MRRHLIVDCETSSLTADYASGAGVIWELAVIELGESGERTEHLWRMKPDLAVADRAALDVGRFGERTAAMAGWFVPHACDLAGEDRNQHWSDPAVLAAQAAQLLDGATITGAVPSFDAGFLSAYLSHYGQLAAPWHYRLRDIGSMAWGYLNACLALGVEGRDAVRGVPSIDASTDDFARALGVDPDAFERHSALGDCRLILEMLRVITGRSA